MVGIVFLSTNQWTAACLAPPSTQVTFHSVCQSNGGDDVHSDTYFLFFFSRLHSNSLRCDCHLAWLSPWLRQRASLGLYAQCSSPPSLRGLNLAELRKSDFACSGMAACGYHMLRTMCGMWLWQHVLCVCSPSLLCLQATAAAPLSNHAAWHRAPVLRCAPAATILWTVVGGASLRSPPTFQRPWLRCEYRRSWFVIMYVFITVF